MGIDTKDVGYTGGEETRRARKVRLEKLRERNESGFISAETPQKLKYSGWGQATKDLGQTKGVVKADWTRHARARQDRCSWQDGQPDGPLSREDGGGNDGSDDGAARGGRDNDNRRRQVIGGRQSRRNHRGRANNDREGRGGKRDGGRVRGGRGSGS